MPGLVVPNVVIDATGLNRGIAASSQVSRRSVPQIVNTAAWWIAVNAKNATPYVTVETIDTQLGTIETPAIGKRGKPLKGRKPLKAGSVLAKNGVPLAVMIVVARARPGSRYNQLTNNRWALQSNPFKGVSRLAGAFAMRELVHKLISGRHSSIKFVLSGWIPVIRKMAKYAVQKYVRGVASQLSDASAWHGAALGDARPANENSLVAVCVIENDVGGQGKNAEAHNRALFLFGFAALQSAVDREGRQQMNYALNKMDQELSKAVQIHWG